MALGPSIYRPSIYPWHAANNVSGRWQTSDMDGKQRAAKNLAGEDAAIADG
jgi:hypothetical protein